jgi:RNA polymerase sigma factor (sigma-70 family)
MDEDFAAFVRDAGPRLRGLAFVLAQTEHDAADLTQECLVRVGLKWSKIRGDRYAYARTTLVRLNVDRFRRTQRETLAPSVPDQSTTDHGSSHIDVDWLPRAWSSLSPHQRTAIGLRYLEDADIDEIAAAMNARPGTVRSHLSRGLARLREQAPQPQRGNA